MTQAPESLVCKEPPEPEPVWVLGTECRLLCRDALGSVWRNTEAGMQVEQWLANEFQVEQWRITLDRPELGCLIGVCVGHSLGEATEKLRKGLDRRTSERATPLLTRALASLGDLEMQPIEVLGEQILLAPLPGGKALLKSGERSAVLDAIGWILESRVGPHGGTDTRAYVRGFDNPLCDWTRLVRELMTSNNWFAYQVIQAASTDENSNGTTSG